MLKIEKHVTMSPEQWEIVIEGMRNPMNSWDKSDSYATHITDCDTPTTIPFEFFVGENDQALMEQLASGGGPHSKYKRMMPVWVTLTAPLYWWKEFDTYKVGTVANSCSTMHKIHSKEFTAEDFSHEHLRFPAVDELDNTVRTLNGYREIYLNWDNENSNVRMCFGDDKKNVWWQMIQLLPSSYNQKRTVMLNYEVLTAIYKWRKDHKLDEWRQFCAWIKELPYSELITLEDEENEQD